MIEFEFIGKITNDWSTQYDALYIGDVCVCEEIKDNYNRSEFVFVNFYISDIPLTKQEFMENFIKSMYGSLDVNCEHVYGTEYTGYMWTNERLKIDGHDLYKDLNSYLGKYCYLKIVDKQKHREGTIKELLNE